MRMFGSIEERLGIHIAYGGSGGGGGGGRRNDRVNTAAKTNRDGTKTMSLSQTASHIAGHSGISISAHTRDGIGISATPTCGSCHDPARNSSSNQR